MPGGQGDFPEVGVEFVAKFFDEYRDKMLKAEGLTMSFGKASVFSLAKGVALGNLMSGALTSGFQSVVGVAQRGAGEMFAYAQGAVAVSSRVQQLDFILQTIGHSLGYTTEFLENQRHEIEDLGITSQAALQGLTEMARANLNLADSSKLARAAQDLATIANADSSATYQNLIYAVSTLNPLVARTAGAIVNLQQEEAKYAEEIGKSVNALTIQEKQQAFVNAILKSAKNVTGAYEVSMKTANKQLLSQARYTETLAQNIGDALLPAYTELIFTENEWLKSLIKATDTGGAFADVLAHIGAVASLVADGIKSGLTFATETFTKFVGDNTDSITGMIDEAFVWGANIIGNLALGIIEGASTVLSTAMQVVAGMLTYWLAPGSPPRVAPNLPEWGSSAMNEYLGGFSKANFDLLSAAQAPLQQALQRLVSLGKISQEKSANLFTNLSERIAKDIAKSGQIAEGTLKAIAKAAGKQGMNIAKLVDLNQQYAKAVNAVKDAQERLTAAQKKVEDQQQAITKLVAQYNELRRGGADAATLAAKRKEIQDAQAGLTTARDQADVAQTDLTASQEKANTLQEQVDLQKSLVDQMQKIADLQAQAAVAAAKAATGGKAQLDIGLPDPQSISEEIKDKLQTAFQLAKANIEIQLNSLRMDLEDRWNEVVAPNLTKIQELWGTISLLIAQAWDEKIKPKLDQFSGWWQTWFGPGGPAQEWRAALTAIGVALAVIVAIGLLPFAVQAAIVAGIIATVGVAVFGLITGLSLLYEYLVSERDYFFEGLNAIIDILVSWPAIWWNILTVVLPGYLTELYDKILAWEADLGTSLANWLTITVPGYFQDLSDRLTEWANGLTEVGKSMVDGIKQGISDNWGRFVGWVLDQLGSLAEKIKKFIGFGSPAKMFIDFGQSMVEGLVVGMNKLLPHAIQTAINVAASVAAPIQHVASGGSGSTVNNITNLNMNANYAQTQSPVQVRDDVAALLTTLGV